MIKTTLAIILFTQTSFALTQSEYKNGVFETPILQKDYQSVSTKHPDSLRESVTTLRKIKSTIKKAASAFGINPLHIAGAILAEHALNVNWEDRFQDANIRRVLLTRWITTAPDAGLFEEMQKAKYKKCKTIKQDYTFWSCIIQKWDSVPLSVKNNSFKRFTKKFFSPNRAGATFGLGQLSPLRALMLTGEVSRRTNVPRLNYRYDGDSYEAFAHILDANKVIYYVAATIKRSIDAYKKIARFDISNNPGVVATLYNIGNENFHANNRLRENIGRLNRGQEIKSPESNKFGRWTIQNQDLIQSIFR